jgi:hypothetical protein
MPSYEEKMEKDALEKEEQDNAKKQSKDPNSKSKWDSLGGAAKVRIHQSSAGVLTFIF